MKKLIKSKRFWIISIIILLVVGFFAIDDYSVKQKRKDVARNAILNVEEKSVNAVKASIDYYYVRNGMYPLSWDNLTEDFKEASQSTQILDDIEKNLSNFEYKVRGDRQAAQIEYIDINGNKQTPEFNYVKDFH